MATVAHGVEGIPGWFWQTDIELFSWFLRAQIEAGLMGDLAELGCYLGRSAVLIGAYQQPGETFTVVDLFDRPAGKRANIEENRAQYDGLSQAAFEANYRRALGRLPSVVRGHSQDVVSFAAHGTHRFVHVDASHLYDQVRGDIAAARVLLASDGVVVFDDIREAHTPGVWAAVWEAAVIDGLRPIAVSEYKMYATWGDAEGWQDRLVASPPSALQFERQGVLGGSLLRFWAEAPVRSKRRVAEALYPPALLRRFDEFHARGGFRALRDRQGWQGR